MIPRTIEFEGDEYRRGKTIKGNRTTYVEYKNIEIGKIKFFENDNGEIKEITDKNDLKDAIQKNYITKSKIQGEV